MSSNLSFINDRRRGKEDFADRHDYVHSGKWQIDQFEDYKGRRWRAKDENTGYQMVFDLTFTNSSGEDVKVDGCLSGRYIDDLTPSVEADMLQDAINSGKKIKLDYNLEFKEVRWSRLLTWRNLPERKMKDNAGKPLRHAPPKLPPRPAERAPPTFKRYNHRFVEEKMISPKSGKEQKVWRDLQTNKRYSNGSFVRNIKPGKVPLERVREYSPKK